MTGTLAPAGKFLGAAALWTVTLALTACLADINNIKADVNNLKQAQFQSQKKIRELEGRTALIQKDFKETKATSKDKASLSALRGSQASLYTQVSDMLRDLQVLNGRFDEYKYLIDKHMRKTAAEIEVVKSKLDSISTSGNLEEISSRLTGIEADITLLKGKLDAIEGLKRGRKGAVSPEKLYSEAYEEFKGKRYKKAREKMQGFLGKYPKDKLAGNAHFWIGETYYKEGAYEDSILSYEEVLQKHKNSPKVPAAMLKQAYAFLKLGEKKAAKAILIDLLKKYPKDEMATDARKKLKALK
jgi:tol-pal system protein YbgF